MLAAIHADPRPANDFEPFRIPMRNLGAVLGACTIALVAVAVHIQVLRADELAVKPHLGLHADGGRRFAYNPRVLDIVRTIPRGTIYDRRGLPLASDDARALAAARGAYKRLGISTEEVCPGSGGRCYPLGGETFHLLGDARTATNWSATNTSYVERDNDARLRGFDDHAINVKTFDLAGRPMYTVHRDHRELVPVLRHRRQPEHSAVVAFRDRPRDVHLTLDADLQRRVAAIVSSYARKAKGRAAAVVLDPDTGAVLASVSYPWPDLSNVEKPALSAADGPALSPIEGAALSNVERGDVKDGADVWMDRARYGAYPPGSTFKLVVALAALRDGAASGRYTCARLPDGRVGARISGWSRPVRDDVLDTRPHGTIGIGEGLAHSCNAYFAQLAASLGPAPLVAVASRLKIPLMPNNGSIQRVRDALPQVGYGQAQVVASPLRMATVAGVVAAEGRLRAPYVDQREHKSGRIPTIEALVDPTDARRLASYMRDVVVNGTGRSLRSHAWPIAGKTGTAEVSGGDSHGWFVGFAPYGPAPYGAKRRIAFAIVIEQAGYGGITAAPAAGEIVTAAAAAGLIGK
jgi:peptidoglycan glycosyltransferase